MGFRTPIGISAVVAIDPKSTVRVYGTVTLTPTASVAVNTLPPVAVSSMPQTPVTVTNPVTLAAANVLATRERLLPATVPSQLLDQAENLEALPALLATYRAALEAFTLTGTEATPGAVEVLARIKTAIAARTTGLIVSVT